VGESFLLEKFTAETGKRKTTVRAKENG